MTEVQASYLRVSAKPSTPGESVRQIQASDGVIVDVDADGRVLGVETIGAANGIAPLSVALQALRVADPETERQLAEAQATIDRVRTLAEQWREWEVPGAQTLLRALDNAPEGSGEGGPVLTPPRTAEIWVALLNGGQDAHGTRLPVEALVWYVAHGGDEAELAAYPWVTAEDLAACRAFLAGWRPVEEAWCTAQPDEETPDD